MELRHLHRETGQGLAAARLLSRGTVTWVPCALEQVLGAASSAPMPAAHLPYLEEYTSATSSGDRILCCDLGRFMNPSSAPETLTLPDTEIGGLLRARNEIIEAG